jgi:DNA-binding MarR family transcriptional regulator
MAIRSGFATSGSGRSRKRSKWRRQSPRSRGGVDIAVQTAVGSCTAGDWCVDIECLNTYNSQVPSGLRKELRQTRPFQSAEHEVFLSTLRTAAVLSDEIEQILRPEGISLTQYNVLRILRGAEPHGLCRNDVRDRMLTRMPDMTRLLDRMEEADLVARARSASDRRLVTTRITAPGLQILDRVDGAVNGEHRRRFGHLSKAEIRTLVGLLERVRQPDV